LKYIDDVPGEHKTIISQMEHIINMYIEQMTNLYNMSKISKLKTGFNIDIEEQKILSEAINNSFLGTPRFKLFAEMYFNKEFDFPDKITTIETAGESFYISYFTWKCVNSLCSIPFHIHNILTSCFLVSKKKYNFHLCGSGHVEFIAKLLINYFDFKIVKSFSSYEIFKPDFEPKYEPTEFNLFDYLEDFNIYTTYESDIQPSISINMERFIRFVS
jgi:hypothetical protein